jgi:hypothetical protein
MQPEAKKREDQVLVRIRGERFQDGSPGAARLGELCEEVVVFGEVL